MEELKLHTCCFFGHRKIVETEKLRLKLYNEIENLIINENVHTFLFGSKSQFDDLCHSTVVLLKKKYSHISRIYVRAEFPYIDDSYKKYLLERYDDTYFPAKILNAGRTAYIERNYEMIDNSRYCVCYYDESYTPPRRKNSIRDLTDYLPKSGTGLAISYARQKQLVIINLK